MTELDTSRAACRHLPTTLFFQDGPGDDTSAQAKAICRGCPIRQACLDYAVDNNIKEGIWGGHTAAERYDARVRNRAVQHGRNTYSHGLCKCDVCTEANRVYQKIKRAEKEA